MMREAGGGSVINLGSISAHIDLLELPVYHGRGYLQRKAISDLGIDVFEAAAMFSHAAALQQAQLAEDLPGVDLLRRAVRVLFASAANCATASIAHHDCDTAIAYWWRAGDHGVSSSKRIL
jgi:hypothetical protein